MPSVKELQEYLKTSPLGVYYSGNVDGHPGPELQRSTSLLQNIIKKELNKSIIITPETLDETKALVNQISKKESFNQNIKAIQEIFNSNPFGINYSGPKDGIINIDLSNKLKELETKIQEITSTQVYDKIVSGDDILVSSEELSKIFKIIKNYQNYLKNKQ